MPADSVHVAAVQHPPVFLDRDATVERACELIREAGANGADLIAFPEGFVSGYPAYYTGPLNPTAGERAAYHTRLLEQSLRVPSAATDRLGEAAATADAYVVIGCNELDDRRGGGSLYNAQVGFDPTGELVLARRKLMPTLSERIFHGTGGGDDLTTIETPFGNLGALICWEHHMPLVRAAMIEHGEHVHVAAWPGNYAYDGTPGSGDACDFVPAIREYAFEAGCFVVSANAILDDADVPADLGGVIDTTSMPRGGSAIVGPTGTYLAGPVYDEETILYADCDMAARRTAKTAFDPVGHYARDDVVRLALADDGPPAGEPSGFPTSLDEETLTEIADAFDLEARELTELVAVLRRRAGGPSGPDE